MRNDVCEPEVTVGPIVHSNVSAPPAVRDRRTTEHDRLQDRQAAGGMYERIAGSQPIGHLGREALDANA